MKKSTLLLLLGVFFFAVCQVEAGQMKRRVVRKLKSDADDESELNGENTEDGSEDLSQNVIKTSRDEGDEREARNLVEDAPKKLKKRRKIKKVGKARDGRRLGGMGVSQRRGSAYIDDPNFLQYHYHYVNTADAGNQYETIQQQVEKQLQQEVEEEQNLLKRQVEDQVPYQSYQTDNIYSQEAPTAYDILETEYTRAVNEDVYNNALDPYNQLLDSDVANIPSYLPSNDPYTQDTDRTVGALNSLSGGLSGFMDGDSFQNFLPLLVGSIALVGVSAAFTPRTVLNATSSNSTKPFGLWAIPSLTDLIPGRRKRDAGEETLSQLYDMENSLDNEINIDALNLEKDEGSYLSEESYIGSYLSSIMNSEAGQEVMWNMMMDSFAQVQNLDWSMLGDGFKQAMLVYSLTQDDPVCQAAIGCRYGKTLRDADYGGGIRSWVEYMMPEQWTTFKKVFSETARGRSDQDCQMYKCEKCLQL